MKKEIKYFEAITMIAKIRKYETIDAVHLLLVEQWDWKKMIAKEDRTDNYLKVSVSLI